MHSFIESTEIVNNNYKVSVSVFQNLSVMGKYTKSNFMENSSQDVPSHHVHVPESCSDQDMQLLQYIVDMSSTCRMLLWGGKE